LPFTQTLREPEHGEVLSVPQGSDPEEVLRGARGELLPPGVPPLVSRWTSGDSFLGFTKKTLSSYY